MTENTRNDQERSEMAPLAETMAPEGEEKIIETVDDALRHILSWANRGTMSQFYTVVSAKLSADAKRDVERVGDTLTFFSVRKKGGFLGIGGRTVRDPALRLTQEGDRIVTADDPLDTDFAMGLARLLPEH
jgi:hypothetical protein